MDHSTRVRLKELLEKLIGRTISEEELDKVINRYNRSTKSGENRVIESIAAGTNATNFIVKSALAAADDTERVKNDLINLLNQD